jgi:hypothetical protein
MKAGSQSNEVILRVRQHEGDRFPIIARWNASRKGFVCKSGEPSSSYITGAFIPDNWATARQA